MATATRRRTTKTGNLQLHDRLVLNQWMLGLFEVETLEALVRGALGDMTDPMNEGLDEENRTRFHEFLTNRTVEFEHLPAADLLRYDDHIVRHWKSITERRQHEGRRLMPKYFQYLALLFSEIYLDRYFDDPSALLASLNEQREALNGEVPAKYRLDAPFGLSDLNKLAFWMATGSGKTLLMHVHLKQYRHYLARAGRERELNRIILLTPNEGLSAQHLEEFGRSGIAAELFVKDGGGLFVGDAVEIIDIHKLREDTGEKTVAVEAFEGNNLVLVDEGHRGASSSELGAWMDRRNRLCEEGFSFEYSATFGQAVGPTGNLSDTYARSILFDYSYKYFYADGYGKDYHILNLEDDSKTDIRDRYLTACLLAFYQQRRLFLDGQAALAPYLIEAPLLVLVGGKVTASLSKQEGSDITTMLLFLARFVANEGSQSVERIRRLLSGNTGLLDPNDRDIFANAFGYLARRGLTPEEVYHDVRKVVFNADERAGLHIEDLKGADGELALRIGPDNPEFGVINVGDPAALRKLCEQFGEFVVEEREFSGSLFGEINRPASPVTMLIGAKKFMEGWNSWRVSTMGLMNVGKSEGSNIIQLFGRGVRLKGWEFSLKRTRHLPDLEPPEHIEVLETLNIFGVHADYMRQFKEFLEQEGLPANEDRESIVIPVIKTEWSGRLRTLRVRDGLDFKRQGPTPVLQPRPPAGLEYQAVLLDWYPRIQSRRSPGARAESDVVHRHEGKLGRRHLAFIDWDQVYDEIQRFKAERSWHNLSLPRETLRGLLDPDNAGWYRLLIPEVELRANCFGRVAEWQEIATTLLRGYLERYYTNRKSAWEMPRLAYYDLREDDPNFVKEHRFLVERSQEQIIQTLRDLKQRIDAGDLTQLQLPLGPNGSILGFSRHLYQPLVYLGASEFVEVKPVPLNAGERNLVDDLRAYHEAHHDRFEDREIYLLRNQSRRRGIGFFEEGGFYPDFILWLLEGERQQITFLDPKGLRNIGSIEHPKLRFHRDIKVLERRMGEPNIILNSFILSTTQFLGIPWRGDLTVRDFEERHVYFRTDDSDDAWVAKLLDQLQAARP